MTVHVHELAGCTTTPLGSYLKALGILRIVAEQADPGVRGFWRNEHFWLATALDRNEFEAFLLDRYAPSPLVSPWNGGSGFYDEGKKDDPLAPLVQSVAERFATLRAGLAEARTLLGGRTAKPDAGGEKDALVRGFKVRASARLRPWLDACVVVLDGKKGAPDPRYPALLGTGGNDGNLDYTDQYLRQLALLFVLEDPNGAPRSMTGRWLRGALSGDVVRTVVGGGSGRQFDPGGAGGKNSGAGFDGSSHLNPWDLVFALEGATIFTASVHQVVTTALSAVAAAAPFSIERRATGSPSSSDREQGRAEVWVPLWSRPAGFSEVTQLFREGRSTVGRRRSSTPVDFARSIARLGVARGCDAFERYSFQQRNGNMHFAVPLGRWNVTPQPHHLLLDEIDPWLSNLRRWAGGKHAPESWREAARRCDDAVLDLCRGGESTRWQRLLLALAAAERALVASPKRTAEVGLHPIPPLSPEWVHAADDGGSEMRLAVALASQHATWPEAAHPVREHWSPVEESDRRFATNATGIDIGPDVVCMGVDLERDCVALVQRRVLRARFPWRAQNGAAASPEQVLPLAAPWACSARLADIDAFLSRRIDDARLIGLARALMAVRWADWGGDALPRSISSHRPDALFAIFRLVHLPHGLRRGQEVVSIAVDPEVVTRLAVGDLHGAARIALGRLRASGLRPVMRSVAGNPAVAKRLCASLAFALHSDDITRAADTITKPYELEES